MSFTTNGLEYMDRLTSMAIFVRTVELGGFAAAAAEADLSATMAAKHVKALEARLGSRLLNRTTRSQSLTEVGQLYYERCKTLLADVHAAESSINALRAAPRGVLKITAPLSFGVHCLAPALRQFFQLYPDVDVELMLNDRVVDLVDEGYEAAIRIGTLADSQLIARPLQPYRSVLAASPAYLKAHGTPATPQDLKAHACLGFSLAGARHKWRLVSGSSEEAVQVSPRLRVNNGEALRQAALAGAGIAMQPEVLLLDDIKAKRLIRVLPDWAPSPRKMHLVYMRDRQPTPKLRCFVDFVVKRFGEEALAM